MHGHGLPCLHPSCSDLAVQDRARLHNAQSSPVPYCGTINKQSPSSQVPTFSSLFLLLVAQGPCKAAQGARIAPLQCQPLSMHSQPQVLASPSLFSLLAVQGRAGLPKCAIITALDGKPTPDLATFAALLRLQPHGARTPLEYYTFGERHRRKNAILHIDRQWCV
eukprot:1159410-Pelagomonas_calceolata.AAC.4